MTYSTQAQRDLIARLSGKSVSAAAADYGFDYGHSLSVRDASEIIDSLKAPAVSDAEYDAVIAAQVARDAIRAQAEAEANAARHARAAAIVAESEARFEEACRLAALEAGQ